MKRQTDSNSIRQQAVAWVVSRHSGTFGATEQHAFERWLAADPEHARVFNNVEKAWSGLPLPSAELAAARRRRPAARSGAWLSAPGLAVAASLLLAIGLGVWEGWPLLDANVYRTAKGEAKTVVLADGSIAELNSDSELAVHYDWRGRSLELRRGEVMFSVAPARLRPFEVSAGGARIRDIGTRFDVAVADKQSRVAVLEGEIELVVAATGERRLTLAGQAMSYNGATVVAEPAKADVEVLTAWQNGKLIFRNTPLSEVIQELARYHPQHFRLADPALAHLTLGGVFDNKDLDRFLVTLEAVLPVEARRAKNGDVVIERRKS